MEFIDATSELIRLNLPVPIQACECGDIIYRLHHIFQCPTCGTLLTQYGGTLTQYGGTFPMHTLKGEHTAPDREWVGLCNKSKRFLKENCYEITE